MCLSGAGEWGTAPIVVQQAGPDKGSRQKNPVNTSSYINENQSLLIRGGAGPGLARYLSRYRAWLGGRRGPGGSEAGAVAQAVLGQNRTTSPRPVEREEAAGKALRVSRNTWRACRAHLAH